MNRYKWTSSREGIISQLHWNVMFERLNVMGIRTCSGAIRVIRWLREPGISRTAVLSGVIELLLARNLRYSRTSFKVRFRGNVIMLIAIVHCYLGQFERANERFEKAAELDQDDEGNPWRARCWLQQGRTDEALAEAERIESETRRLWILPMAYYDLGQREASDRALNELIEKHPDKTAAFIAENYAWRGELDPAFMWLNRTIEEKQYRWSSLVFDPAFSKLHADPAGRTSGPGTGGLESSLQKSNFDSPVVPLLADSDRPRRRILRPLNSRFVGNTGPLPQAARFSWIRPEGELRPVPKRDFLLCVGNNQTSGYS